MKKHRIALVGAGNHGIDAVLPAMLKVSDRLSIVGVAEPNTVNREKVAALCPGAATFTSIEQLLAEASPEIVYVATLPHLHAAHAMAAFAAGCHVVSEKPLAPGVADCRLMVDTAARAGRRLVTMFENRYKPHFVQIRAWISAGQIGRVGAMHFQKFWPGPVTEPRRSNLLNASGSLDCGIHTLDLARFFVDGGAWESVHAMGEWFDEAHLENPPHTAILARLAGGPLVTLNDSMSYRVPRAKRTGERWGPSSLMILGDAGDIQHVEGGYRLHAADGTEAFTPAVASTHADEIPHVLEDLLSAIETGKARSGFLPTGEDGVIAQQIVEEANRQARATRQTAIKPN